MSLQDIQKFSVFANVVKNCSQAVEIPHCVPIVCIPFLS